MSRTVRAALTQTVNAYRDMPTRVEDLPRLADRLGEVREANVEHHLGLLQTAADEGVEVCCLGELFPGPYFALGRDPLWFDLAEDAATGPTVSALRAAAREHSLVIVAPIYELDGPSGQRFNTAVVIDEGGEVLGKYRKTHVPSGTNERASFCEDYYYRPSDGRLGNGPADVSANPYFPVFETTRGRIGVAICYDRHFEGVMRALARGGAQIVFSPAVTFGEKSRRMWALEFPVDAARHNLFIGGSNRHGTEPPWNVRFFGGSFFCGPNGRVDARRGHPELVIADLDLAELERPDSSGWDLARDERPEIYGTRGPDPAPRS